MAHARQSGARRQVIGAGLAHRALAAVRTRRWYPAAGHAPILLWRAGLGPVLGLVFGIVSVRGRTTGRVRHNLVTYRRVDGRTFLLGLYGRRSHWYRNLLASSEVTFQTGLSTRPMRARPLTEPADLLDAFGLLRARSPLVFRGFYLWALGMRDDPSEFVANAERASLVELQPAPAEVNTPQPVRTDLLWVWPVAALAWFGWRRLRRHG